MKLQLWHFKEKVEVGTYKHITYLYLKMLLTHGFFQRITIK